MDLEKLKRKRTSIRTSVTKTINRLKEKIEAKVLDEVEELSELLLVRENELDDLDRQIIELISDETMEVELIGNEEYKEAIILIKVKARRLLNNTGSPTQTLQHSDARSNLLNFSPLKIPHKESNTVRLPKLNILQFGGDIEMYQNFWDQFEISIHKNSSLSGIQKFCYLKGLLNGEAATVLTGLAITETNYDLAIEMLKERYGNKDILINGIINRLISLQPVKESNNIKALRNVYDSVVIGTRSLNNLGVANSAYGTILCPLILKIIPTNLVGKWFQTKDNRSSVDLDKLLKFVQNEIESKEQAHMYQQHYPDDSNKSVYNRKTNSFTKCRQSSTSVLNIAEKKRYCYFCKDEHWTTYCDKDMTIDKRRDIIQKCGLCFNCLRKGHSVQNCRINHRCAICNGKHNDLICPKRNKQPDKISDIKPVRSEICDQMEDSNGKSSNINMCSTNKAVYLPTFVAIIRHENKQREVRCLIDSGSERSFIHKDLVNEINLPVCQHEKISIQTFGNINSKFENRSVYSVTLENPDNVMVKIPVNLIETNEICGSVKVRENPVIDGYSIDSIKQVDILIGCDHLHQVLIESNIRGVNVISTVFNDCIYGTLPVNSVCFADEKCHLDSFDIKQFWELDAIGIGHSDTKNNMDSTLDKFNEMTNYSNGRYTTGLLWDCDFPIIHNNFDNALNRLKRLKSKLIRNNAFDSYNQIFDDYRIGMFIEKVPVQLENSYYIPHHAVIKESETTSVRIVFDASSKVKNEKSLNDCLLSGSNLYPNLFDILIRFRLKPIILIADIAKAFLQIELNESDRDYCRFLWYERNEVVSYRFKRVAFGIKCSPFLLNATIKKHLNSNISDYPDTVDCLKDNFYVDDMIVSLDNSLMAKQIFSDSRDIMNKAGMCLRKWASNDSVVTEYIREKSDISDQYFMNGNEIIKVLGINWNKNNDWINCCLQFTKTNLSVITKRMLLSRASNIFDPLGLLCPVTIRLKIMMQSLWESGIEWDDKLPDDISNDYVHWEEDIEHLVSIQIPRLVATINDDTIHKVSLHVFTDSSEKAYAATVYVRSVIGDKITTNLVTAKARVSPIKRLTLPRLELLGAVIGARLTDNVKKAIDYPDIETVYWCDSQIVLCWIKSHSSKWKTFVCNRIAEIQMLSDPSKWRYCPGKDNPADLATRGISGKDLTGSDKWLFGPSWLRDHADKWPPDKHLKKFNDEMRKISINVVSSDERFIEYEKFSNIDKVIRIVVYVYRYMNYKRKLRGEIIAEEITAAEKLLIKQIQKECYPVEYKTLCESKVISTNSSLMVFRPFIHEGMIRACSRLKNAEVTFGYKYPIILPNNHQISKLIIQKIHWDNFHLGVQVTLSKLREKYLVIRGRRLVKQVIGNCIVCKRFNSKPISQPTAPLPKDRVNPDRPFSCVGIDFAGPIFIRSNEPEKSYICLFTCGVTRAIHLELVSNLSTDSFLLAFKRFVARRGLCSIIYSDNAKTFKCAEKDLNKLWNSIAHPDVSRYYAAKRIKWRFIVERAPWWGGFYERLVRTTKSCLRKILGKALLTAEELTTYLAEVESIINSRPLTFSYNELNELSPLTPNSFLISNLCSLPPDQISLSKRDDFINRLVYREKLINHFWNRWYTEYLNELRSGYNKSVNIFALNIGDIVLVNDSNLPRQMWKLGVVEQLLSGKNEPVRAAIIRLANGTVKRAIQHLCPLEISEK